LLGALPPDETVQPFPLNRPRLWDEKLALASDKPKEKLTIKSALTSPTGRLVGLGLVGVAVIAAVVFGLILPNNNPLAPHILATPGPSPTFTLTPTFVNATEQAAGGKRHARPTIGTAARASYAYASVRQHAA